LLTHPQLERALLSILETRYILVIKSPFLLMLQVIVLPNSALP